MMNQIEMKNSKKHFFDSSLFYVLLLLIILTAGAYFRFIGLNWDQEQHLHPDERFLTMVETAIKPVENLGDYFDTANSTLNPRNQGYTFYVYGTWPLFIVRYVSDWLNMTGYGNVYLVGRALSALVDLLTILIVFIVGARLYDRRVGILASSFYAFSVLAIQQSHFFTVDAFLNFFIFLSVLFAGDVAIHRLPRWHNKDDSGSQIEKAEDLRSLWKPFLFFGIAFGMGLASKINAAPVVIALLLGAFVCLITIKKRSRYEQSTLLFAYLVLAGVVSLLTFRLLQPYAFSGPGFFGLKINPAWIANIKELRAQTTGDVDFPPALQWARRPIWFSFQNMILWGLGLPLGLLAWVGFLWMGWRMIQGEWKRHLVLWGWTGLYFLWQSTNWNSTMRYQYPIYPTLAVIAGWAIIALWDSAPEKKILYQYRLRRSVAAVIALVVLIASFAWAFAFTHNYTQPHTRVAATRWLLQTLPGPVTLQIENQTNVYHQPLSVPEGFAIEKNNPLRLSFEAKENGVLSEILLPHVLDKRTTLQEGGLQIELYSSSSGDDVLASGHIEASGIADDEGGTEETWVQFEPVVTLSEDQIYYVVIHLEGGLEAVDLCGPLYLNTQTQDENLSMEISEPPECIIRDNLPHRASFSVTEESALMGLSITSLRKRQVTQPSEQVIKMTLTDPEGENVLGQGWVKSMFEGSNDKRGDSYGVALDSPVQVEKGKRYSLELALNDGNGSLVLQGSAIANESTWDDGLPLRMDGYDPFGGIYKGGLNFEMYWDDNEEKYNRFVNTLDAADMILITSSRQWASTTRLPERYPLTSAYYRHLVGCPSEKSIEYCYNTILPGEDHGDLGFNLVKVFQSNPRIGNFEINDQFAEEAFTVYDHPKVFVFAKNQDYEPEHVREVLRAVDLSRVVHVTPRQAGTHPANLMLPQERLSRQYAGGTWSSLFNRNSIFNRVEILGVLLWYLGLLVVGLVAYPILRYALSGLSDRAYPLSRIFGLLLLAWITWISGSIGLTFSRLTIAISLGVIVIISAGFVYIQRDELRQEWKTKRKYFLTVEGLFLIFLVFGLLVRFGNPDLWHPWKGGEKPMDFSYFNAVLKSTSFPPYDPWFEGGYINYYYYGFVIVGVLVKLLGIVPSFAYNLIVPSLFAMTAMGAFSIAWNLITPRKGSMGLRATWLAKRQIFTGLSGALLMAVFGNLGIWQMFYRGFQLIGAPVGKLDSAGFLHKMWYTIIGASKAIVGAPMPYRVDEWYWNPSRVIGSEYGSPITEFPYFTFLYGDLHAHMIAMPIAMLIIAWALSVIRGRAWERVGKRSLYQVLLGLFVGGLAIGAMYPVNLSDIYTYLPLGIVVLGYAISRYWNVEDWRALKSLPSWAKRLAITGLGVSILVLFSFVLYRPYSYWYAQGYSKVALWSGLHTPIPEYLTHWGLFLFIIVSWLIYESIDWMSRTPVSALRKLRNYRETIYIGIGLLLIVMFALGINLQGKNSGELSFPVGLGIPTAWIILPLAAWIGVLLLRSDQNDRKRFVLLLSGTALLLTLVVEVVTVKGDIGRMNTVFKFYLQAWALLSVSTAAAFYWLVSSMRKWKSGWGLVWQICVIFLVGVVALYPLISTMAKVRDRITSEAPHTLDGMRYMQYAQYSDLNTTMDLSQDYNAIRWMQESVQGSPVIVEANMVEYHWGTRYTIYTGLPGVVGWNWHERQQRAVTPQEWVFNRIEEVNDFYKTTDLEKTRLFLEKYGVEYIILGQLELAKYPGDGLDKFVEQEGTFWKQVYQDRDTKIYQVLFSDGVGG